MAIIFHLLTQEFLFYLLVAKTNKEKYLCCRYFSLLIYFYKKFILDKIQKSNYDEYKNLSVSITVDE